MTPQAYCTKHKLTSADFARVTGLSPAFAWRLLTGKRKASYEVAHLIEKATGGKVRARDVRPDLLTKKGLKATVSKLSTSIANRQRASQDPVPGRKAA